MSESTQKSHAFTIHPAPSQNGPSKLINAELCQHTDPNNPSRLNILSIFPSNLSIDVNPGTNIFLMVKNGNTSLKPGEKFDFVIKWFGIPIHKGQGSIGVTIFLGQSTNLIGGTSEFSYSLEVTIGTEVWKEDPKITLNPGMKL